MAVPWSARPPPCRLLGSTPAAERPARPPSEFSDSARRRGLTYSPSVLDLRGYAFRLWSLSTSSTYFAAKSGGGYKS